MKQSSIIILDFGSQYTRLIARRVRGLGFYSKVLPGSTTREEVLTHHPAALILSGGPESAAATRAPWFDNKLLTLGIPVLGICYGMCLLVNHYGGEIGATRVAEYGPAVIDLVTKRATALTEPRQQDVRRGSGKASGKGVSSRSVKNNLKAGETRETRDTGETDRGRPLRSHFYHTVPKRLRVWMSHGDSIVRLPENFTVTATSREKAKTLIASFEDSAKGLYGVQYHPEVVHTEWGEQLLSNFLIRAAKLAKTWSPPSFLKIIEKRLRVEVGTARDIVVAVSGGVDSTVMAVLLARIFKSRVNLVCVDNGLLRKGEVDEIRHFYQKQLKLPLQVIEASEQFLKALTGVRAPEVKRRIIGKMFVKVFFSHVRPIEMLAQGTLYPDVIESIATVGPAHTIKTHHNRVREILDLMERGQIIEPFKDLFKDEVRELGRVLKVPEPLLNRHPFPGPGLAVRILGTVTERRLTLLREADAILQEELKQAQLLEKTWQVFAVLLPIRSVGVAGDRRHYGETIVIRAVTSSDGMTADFFVPPKAFLTKVSARITGEVKGITRVALDISSKPPATIEWE